MRRITCKNCGEKNERKFDKCWNCEWPLIASEAKSAEVRRGGDMRFLHEPDDSTPNNKHEAEAAPGHR